MPSAHLAIKEEDVVKLCLEFLQNRSLHIAQLCLERETGIINGCHSDDALFLRQLILDGQWEDVLEFVQPLEMLDVTTVILVTSPIKDGVILYNIQRKNLILTQRRYLLQTEDTSHNKY